MVYLGVYGPASKFPNGRSNINIFFFREVKLFWDSNEPIVRRFTSVLSSLCPRVSYFTHASLRLALASLTLTCFCFVFCFYFVAHTFKFLLFKQLRLNRLKIKIPGVFIPDFCYIHSSTIQSEGGSSYNHRAVFPTPTFAQSGLVTPFTLITRLSGMTEM